MTSTCRTIGCRVHHSCTGDVFEPDMPDYDDGNDTSTYPMSFGCPTCHRSRYDCRNVGCGESSNCDVCRVPLADPVTYVRCERCREAA